MSGSKPHTVRIVGADIECFSKASKTAALRFAYEIHNSRGCKVEIYEGDYVADRRVVDGEPIKTLE